MSKFALCTTEMCQYSRSWAQFTGWLGSLKLFIRIRILGLVIVSDIDLMYSLLDSCYYIWDLVPLFLVVSRNGIVARSNG